MASLGQKLKDERTRQGKQIRTIAEELRIGSRYLEAIEADDWKQLPGGFFNRSFIRQYAVALGFDPSLIEQEFGSTMRPESASDLDATGRARDPRAALDDEKSLISVEPLSRPQGGFFDSRTGLAVAALVILVAGGGALSLLWDKIKTAPEPAAQTGANTAAPVTPGPKQPGESPAAAVQPPAATPAGGESTTPPEEKPVEQAKVLSTATSDSSGNLTLNIEATEKTWIEVSADGKRIFMGVLEPGESKSISTQQRARMVVGNAGGIAVRKGGQDIGPIGPRGQVRTVNITPDAVEIVAPPKPSSSTT